MPQIFTEVGQFVGFIEPDMQAEHEKKYKPPFAIHSSKLNATSKVSKEYWDELIKLRDADGKIFPEAEDQFIDAFEITKLSRADLVKLEKVTEKDEDEDYALSLRDSI